MVGTGEGDGRHALRYALVGTREQVQAGLKEFFGLTGADEIIITAQIYDHEARKRSYEIVAEASVGPT